MKLQICISFSISDLKKHIQPLNIMLRYGVCGEPGVLKKLKDQIICNVWLKYRKNNVTQLAKRRCIYL